MKVKIGSRQEGYKTLWLKDSIIFFIDQRKLPKKFEIFKAENYRETARAIRDMVVRGAPAIGVTAAYGMTQAALEFSGDSEFESFLYHMETAEKTLKETRPTAFDLFYAVNEVRKKIKKAKTVKEAKEIAKEVSGNYARSSEEKCRLIGEYGKTLIRDDDKILTHCNAGALACVDYGTALAPIRFAYYNGKKIFVWVDETRPRLQGAKLTAWELYNEDIPHAIVADNAAGYFMKRGEVNLVIVGADRIAKNGDVANKIGTYEKAVLAKENEIPFYVAAPLTTIDRNCETGNDIKIEERSEEEVLFLENERVSPEGSKARNPAFDVTPKKYITGGIITEKGIFKPDEIEKEIFS